jgi:hypothetical protein
LKQLFVFLHEKQKQTSGEDGGKRKKLLCGQFSFPRNSKGGREGGDTLSPVQKTRKEQQLLPRRSIATTNLQRRRRKKIDRQTDLERSALQHSRLIKIVAPAYPSSSNGRSWSIVEMDSRECS